MRRALTIAFAVAAALGGVASVASAGTRFSRDGVAFHMPRGWQLTIGRINGVIDPVTVFTASTFRVPADVPSVLQSSNPEAPLAAKKHRDPDTVANE